MKFKKIFCNMNILVLFFGFKLAMEIPEISEPSKSYNNDDPPKEAGIEEIEELYCESVEKNGLKRIFFSVMLRFLKFTADVEQTKWDQEIEESVSLLQMEKQEVFKQLRNLNLNFLLTIKKLKAGLFGDNPEPKFYFEKTKLFNFISEKDFSGENNEWPDWIESPKCKQYIGLNKGDKSRKGNESDKSSKIYKNDEFVEFYNLTISQALLLKKYYYLWLLVNLVVMKSKELSIEDVATLQKYIGKTPNNAKYSFLSVILLKCFELFELERSC